MPLLVMAPNALTPGWKATVDVNTWKLIKEVLDGIGREYACTLRVENHTLSTSSDARMPTLAAAHAAVATGLGSSTARPQRGEAK